MSLEPGLCTTPKAELGSSQPEGRVDVAIEQMLALHGWLVAGFFLFAIVLAAYAIWFLIFRLGK